MASGTAPDAFCLRRSSHPLDVIGNLEKMFKDENMVDVTLACEDGTIRAHKLILSASSSYFGNLFARFTNPSQYPVVIMKDMPFVDLKAIIDFIYRGEVTVPQDQLPSLLKSAEMLKVKGLSGIHNPKSGKGGENQENSSGSSRKRRKRKRKRHESSSHHHHHHHHQQQGQQQQGAEGHNNINNSEEDAMSGRRESSEDNSEYTDEEESSPQSTTITPVCSRRRTDRTYNENNSNVDGDIEPARLLEQTMITGEGPENGNTVPRYSASVNLSNVQPLNSVSSQDVKPLMFDETPSMIPHISVSLAGSMPQNETSSIQSNNSSQNHLPPSSVPCTMSAFESGMSSIPGPSSISHHVSRPSQPAQG